MEKCNSRLLLERNDFKGRLEALEEERDKLWGKIEVQGIERFLVDDFAEEKNRNHRSGLNVRVNTCLKEKYLLIFLLISEDTAEVD